MANGYDDGFAATGSPEYEFDKTYLTDVGAYTLAAGPWGTFDMGGNATEFDERLRIGATQIFRGTSGGGFGDGPDADGLNARFGRVEINAFTEIGGVGFRVATIVPEPRGGGDRRAGGVWTARAPAARGALRRTRGQWAVRRGNAAGLPPRRRRRETRGGGTRVNVPRRAGASRAKGR